MRTTDYLSRRNTRKCNLTRTEYLKKYGKYLEKGEQ